MLLYMLVIIITSCALAMNKVKYKKLHLHTHIQDIYAAYKQSNHTLRHDICVWQHKDTHHTCWDLLALSATAVLVWNCCLSFANSVFSLSNSFCNVSNSFWELEHNMELLREWIYIVWAFRQNYSHHHLLSCSCSYVYIHNGQEKFNIM